MNPQNNPIPGATAPQNPPIAPPPQTPANNSTNSQFIPQSIMPPQAPASTTSSTMPTPPPNAPTMPSPTAPTTTLKPTIFDVQQPTIQPPAYTSQPTTSQPTTPQVSATQPITPLAQQPTQPQPLSVDPNPPKVVEAPISTQATLQFSELRDSLIIMKDGSFRAVVACQSINFDLMSEQEREAIELSYQNFLNSLNFTVQILVRSQRVDIGPYIEKLNKIRRNNDNMLLGVLMDDYINFIDVLSQEANIMDKSFFVVIPYYSSADLERTVEQTKNLFKVFSKNKNPSVTRINRDIYDKAINELNNRVESVVSGLFQIGIQSVRLNTKELSQLFYNFNNPDTAVREPLVDFSKLATTYVKKGVK